MKKLFAYIIVAVMMASLPALASAEKMLQVKGSDTLINLVQRLSEVYMEENPGAYIAVTGGGSGTGIAALVNDRADIANASRLMKPKEMALADGNGVTANRVVIAMDGLSVITNDGHDVDQLTVDQIGAIFRGDIKNWSDLGGPDMPITLYGRQSNSGTYVYFQDYILKGDYSQKMRRMNGNAQIIEAIKADKSAIGYVGVGYIKDGSDGMNVVKVAAKEGDVYASPLNSSDVSKGLYPLSRPLNQYVNGKPTGAAKAFLDFELSTRGQQIVIEEGFFPIPSEYAELNAKAGL